MPYVSFDPYLCVLFMTLALAINGSSMVTNMQNPHDLTPNYASTVFGIINAIGSTAGFLTPLVVANFTQERVT